MISTLIKACLILVSIVFLTAASRVYATVEWNIQNTVKTEAVPLDVALSPDGKSVFVLTDDGKVLIYNRNGKLKDTIRVGTHVDQIRIGPSGEQLFATSRKKRTVEVITLTFIHKINILGSPFKGPEEAPVIITVFTDFQ